MDTDTIFKPAPKGILKNLNSTGIKRDLVWDEQNLALNEVQKDSTMKITEPKTPYVRYNAETDEIMDLDKIPGFELGRADQEAQSYSDLSSPSRSESSNPNSRRGSEASEKMVKVDAGPMSAGEEEEDDDDETRAHRRKFAEMRGGHYRNEAEAMKKQQALMDEEESSGTGEDVIPPMPTTHSNGK